MQPSTDHERMIHNQVTPHLREGEGIRFYGYLSDASSDDGKSISSTGFGWLLALTNDRLFRIQTAHGTYAPNLEKGVVEAYELIDLDQVILDELVIMVFRDGTALGFREDARADTLFSTQRNLLAWLVHQFPQQADPLSDESESKLSVTSALLALNIIVFVLMVLDGVSFISPTTRELIDWGANFGPRTVGGETWRLLTCTFVHIGIIHIGFNMWVLSDLGKVVEKLVGPVGFLGMYIVSGLCGSIASTWWNPMVVSAGASGAVFGTAGAFGAIIVLSRGIIAPDRVASMKNSIGGFIVYNLMFGFAIPGIDQAAHIGGVIAGGLCGVLLAGTASLDPSRARRFRGVLVTVIALPLVAGLTTLLPNDVSKAQAVLEEFARVEKHLLTQLDAASKRNATDAEVSVLIESELQPAWRKVGQRLEGLTNLPDRLQKRVDALIRFAALRDKSWSLVIESERQKNPELLQKAMDKEREAQELIRAFSSGD